MLMHAGDCLVFNDSLLHGATARLNPDGQRRMLCFRYMPPTYRYRWARGHTPPHRSWSIDSPQTG